MQLLDGAKIYDTDNCELVWQGKIEPILPIMEYAEDSHTRTRLWRARDGRLLRTHEVFRIKGLFKSRLEKSHEGIEAIEPEQAVGVLVGQAGMKRTEAAKALALDYEVV